MKNIYLLKDIAGISGHSVYTIKYYLKLGIIEEIGSLLADQHHLPKQVDQIDLSGHLIFPGLIDAHTHASQSLIRGLGGERPLEQWVEEVEFPALRYTTPELTYHGTMVSISALLYLIPSKSSIVRLTTATLPGVSAPK